MVPELFLPLASLAFHPLLGSGSRRAVGWSLVGALLILLGVAAAVPDWSDLGSAPATFVAVSAGFVWLGIGVIASGTWLASRGDAFALRRLGPLGANLGITAAALAGAYVVASIWPLLFAGSWRGVLAALGLGASGAVLGVAIPRARVAQGIRWLDRRWLAPERQPGEPLTRKGAQITWALLVAAVLVVLFTPHLFAFTAGALGATAAGHRLARPLGRTPRAPVQEIVAGVALLIFLWWVWTIAGSEISLRFPGILETPFSDAAEAALALVMGLGAWALLGLWPWHGSGPGSSLAIVGGVFMIRWGAGLIPGGVLHAAPIYAMVVVAAVIHAAATGRVGEYAAALGVLAVLGGGAGGWGFFGLASCLATLRLARYELPLSGLDRRQIGGIVLLPLLAWSLPEMLSGQTFATVAAVLCGAALFRPAEAN